MLKEGGVFAPNDDMRPRMYGDMEAFAQELRDMGYQEVRLIDTAQEAFGSRRRAALMMLGDSRMLVGMRLEQGDTKPDCGHGPDRRAPGPDGAAGAVRRAGDRIYSGSNTMKKSRLVIQPGLLYFMPRLHHTATRQLRFSFLLPGLFPGEASPAAADGSCSAG